jgi:uncharacterized protein YbjQ (UPF0145 family)
VLDLIVLVTLLALGYVFGQLAEKRHYRSIRRREAELRALLVIPTRFPPMYVNPPRTTLVTGSVVISVDFFKVFVAGLRKLIGGRMTSYESLIVRARRVALLRMKEQARRQGATMIFNVKFEAVPLYKGQRQGIQSVEALAYGTALIPARPPAGPGV